MAYSRHYAVINRDFSEVNVAPLISAIEGAVYQTNLLSDDDLPHLVWLVERGYLDGLYVTHPKLAADLCKARPDGAPITGYIDSMWRSHDKVSYGDVAYEAMNDLITPKLVGESNVMVGILGTGRMAITAMAVLSPLSLYIGIGSRGGNMSGMSAMAGILDRQAEIAGKRTCTAEFMNYGDLPLDAMDVIVNATPLPFAEIAPGFAPRDGQLIVDLSGTRISEGAICANDVRATQLGLLGYHWCPCSAHLLAGRIEKAKEYLGC